MPISETINLDADGWELMTAANWDEDRKMSHLRTLWTRVIGTLVSGAASQAA